MAPKTLICYLFPTFSKYMQFKYNLTAVGVRTEFPYVSLDRCMGIDCPRPGAEVSNSSFEDGSSAYDERRQSPFLRLNFYDIVYEW